MNRKWTPLQMGALVIVCSVLLRMICMAALGDSVPIFAHPQLASYLIAAETGREPELQEQTTPTTPTTQPTDPTQSTTEPTQPVTEPPAPVEKPVFTEEDVELISMTYGCKLKPDLKSLLVSPLKLNLQQDAPTVLIVHSHGTEAYTQTADRQYEEFGGSYRTKDERYNMISIGDELTRLLEERGIQVIHDRTPYDLNDYNDSYDNSRAAVQKHLQENPTIELVLDLHRDSATYDNGKQWPTSATINGENSAQVMLVVGTNATGLTHPNWQQNLALAEKLNVTMERTCSGVARPINLRGARFNQDLLPGALIVEVGSAGNTHEEAMRPLPVLADAIAALANGAN